MIVEGMPSGDHECWCLLVDRETFKRVKGEYPKDPEKDESGYEMRWDVGPFAEPGSPYKYMLYPHDLIGYETQGKVVEIKIEVTWK